MKKMITKAKKKKWLILALIPLVFRLIVVVRARMATWANNKDLTVGVSMASGRIVSIGFDGTVTLNDGMKGKLNFIGSKITFANADWVKI